MREIKKLEEGNSSSWNQPLNAFLDLLDLSSEFIDDKNGIIKEKKTENRIGQSRVLPYYVNSSNSKKNNCILQSDFRHSYGNIRIRLELGDTSSILYFQINRERSLHFNGIMKGHREESKFSIDYLDLITNHDIEEVEKLSLFTNRKDFSYHNYETDHSVVFQKESFFTEKEGMRLSIDNISEEKKRLRTTMVANSDNSSIRQLSIYDRSNGKHIETEKLKSDLSTITNISDQFAYCMSQTNTKFYDQMRNIIASYEWNGFNIVESSICGILLPTMTEEEANCLFSKPLVKEMTSSNK